MLCRVMNLIHKWITKIYTFSAEAIVRCQSKGQQYELLRAVYKKDVEKNIGEIKDFCIKLYGLKILEEGNIPYVEILYKKLVINGYAKPLKKGWERAVPVTDVEFQITEKGLQYLENRFFYFLKYNSWFVGWLALIISAIAILK